jgi:HrpA-like RNA helicase
VRHPGFVSAMFRRDSVDYNAVVGSLPHPTPNTNTCAHTSTKTPLQPHALWRPPPPLPPIPWMRVCYPLAFLPAACCLSSHGPSTPHPNVTAQVTAVCAVCSGALPVPDGAVLVFLPGVIEIRKVNRMLATAVEMGRLTVPVQVLELHGSLTPEEQVRGGSGG